MLELLKESDKKWVNETYEKIRGKIFAECGRIGSRIPYIADNGVHREDVGGTHMV